MSTFLIKFETCSTLLRNHFLHGGGGGGGGGWGRTGLVVRASDSGSGDLGSILGRVGVLFP